MDKYLWSFCQNVNFAQSVYRVTEGHRHFETGRHFFGLSAEDQGFVKSYFRKTEKKVKQADACLLQSQTGM